MAHEEHWGEKGARTESYLSFPYDSLQSREEDDHDVVQSRTYAQNVQQVLELYGREERVQRTHDHPSLCV